jgi:muramidase (phage lysozyme)
VNGITARERALLDTISKAEGTWDSKSSRPRYDITFGYQKVDPSKPHPGRVVSSGGYASDATGAYQFLSPTWKGANSGQNLAMTPENQDRAALELVRRRGVDPTKPLDGAALNRLAPEWASLPTSAGKSFYGQPVKDRQGLLDFYNRRLGAAPNPGNSGAPAPASSAPAPAAAAPGGRAVSSDGNGDAGALLAVLAARNGGSGADLTPLLAGTSSNVSPLTAAAISSSQNLNTLIADLGSSLKSRPAAQAVSADLEGTGQRRFAQSPYFLEALNLLG